MTFLALSNLSLFMVKIVPIKGPVEFQRETDVSDDRLKKFQIYARLLADWNASINLVAPSTIPEIWHRHFMDSAQLFPLVQGNDQTIADIGSGPGFPGMVLAIMGVPKITLIEKNTRKASFLRTVAAETGTKVELLNLDVMAVDATYDVVMARALAEVGELLTLSQKIRKLSTVCLFLKGKNLDQELAKAHKEWTMDVRKMASCTDEEGMIARLSDINPIK